MFLNKGCIWKKNLICKNEVKVHAVLIGVGWTFDMNTNWIFTKMSNQQSLFGRWRSCLQILKRAILVLKYEALKVTSWQVSALWVWSSSPPVFSLVSCYSQVHCRVKKLSNTTFKRNSNTLLWHTGFIRWQTQNCNRRTTSVRRLPNKCRGWE